MLMLMAKLLMCVGCCFDAGTIVAMIIHTHTHSQAHTYRHIHTRTHPYGYTHTHKHTRTHTHIHTYIHTLTHTRIHKHTHHVNFELLMRTVIPFRPFTASAMMKMTVIWFMCWLAAYWFYVRKILTAGGECVWRKKMSMSDPCGAATKVKYAEETWMIPIKRSLPSLNDGPLSSWELPTDSDSPHSLCSKLMNFRRMLHAAHWFDSRDRFTWRFGISVNGNSLEYFP